MLQVKEYLSKFDVSSSSASLKSYFDVSKLERLIKDSMNMKKSDLNEYFTVKNALKAIGVAGISYFTYYTLDLYWKRRIYSHIPGPSTKGIMGFYAGNLTASDFEEGKVLSDFLLEWHKKYGPLVKYQVSNRIILSSIDPETIKTAFIGNGRFSRNTYLNSGFQYFYGNRYIGKCLFTDFDYNSWKHQRSIYNLGFHKDMLMMFTSNFNVKADILMEKLRRFADGKTVVTLFPELNHATFDAIATIICGINVDSLNGDAESMRFYNYSYDIIQTFGIVAQHPFFVLDPFSIKVVLQFKKKVEYLRKVARDKILEKIKSDDLDSQTDLLSKIIKSAKMENFDVEIMVDNLLLFFNAGQDTTANTLAFCFLEIARSKEVQEKCQAEVDEVLGMRTEIKNEDVSKLKYITAVFKESMRLYPAASELSRMAPKGAVLSGHKLPRDTDIMLSTYACCRLEENFSNCLEFQPERFLSKENWANAESDPNMPYKYFPFGLGSQNCIGQTFAKIEAIIVISRLVQSFDLKLVPNQSMKIAQDISIKPADGTKVFLTLRR